MKNLSLIRAALALSFFTLMAQSASALDCVAKTGDPFGNAATEYFANSETNSCASAFVTPGPSYDGHLIVGDSVSVKVDFYNNGVLFTPTSRSLSCTGSFASNDLGTRVEAFFGIGYSTTCSLSYTDPNGQTVSHSFATASILDSGFYVSSTSNFSVNNGWFDHAAPTVVLSGLSGEIGLAGKTVTAEFSEAVTGFSESDLSLTNLTASAFTAISTTEYEFLVTPVTGGAASVQIPTASAQDSVGNDNAVSNTAAATANVSRPTAILSNAGVPGFSNTMTGDSIELEVEFSEDVSTVQRGDLVSTNLNISYTFYVSPRKSGMFVGPSTSGPVSIQVAANSVVNSAGNGNLASNILQGIADTDPPSLYIYDLPSVIGLSGGTATVFLTEPVIGFTADDLNLTNLTVSEFTMVTTTKYTFLVTPIANGAVSVKIPEGAAEDSVGNLSLRSNTLEVTGDIDEPTVVLSGFVGTLGSTGQTVTAIFSEDMTGFAEGDLSLTNLAVSDFTTVNASEYTFLATPIASGAVSVQVPTASGVDVAGNDNAVSNTLSSSADVDEPTVVLSGLSGTVGPAGQTVTATFSEDVTGFVEGDLSLTNLTISAFATVNAAKYTFLATPVSNGATSIQIPLASAIDGAGNDTAVSNTLTATADLDDPTVVLSGMSGTLGSAGQTVTANFSEDVTGFVEGDLSLTNLTVSDFTTVTASEYTFLVSPVTTGAVSVLVPAASGTDAGGNDSEVSNTLNATADLDAPTVTLSGMSGTVGPAGQTVTAIFSEDVTGFVEGDLVLTNVTVSDFTTVSASEYTFLATPVATGAVSVQLPAASAQDSLDNDTAASNTLTATADLDAPTVTLSGMSGTVGPAGQTVTATFSEDVTGFVEGDLVLTNITISDFTTVDASEYTFLATPVATGEMTVQLPAASAQDDLGNDTAGSNTLTATADINGPTVVITGLPVSINGPTTFNATITFSESVTGFTLDEIEVSGADITALSGSGTTYVATVSATGGNDVEMSIPANVAQDVSANGNLASDTVSVENVTAAETGAIIAQFMQGRANLLLANQPDLAGLLRGGGGGGHFKADLGKDIGILSFDSGSDKPIWARMNANWSNNAGADSLYVFGVLGGHAQISEDFLLGGMLQIDVQNETNGAATINGTGWLAGPYFVAKLPDQPLYFEGSLLYGRSNNEISPFGTYTDQFTTERWLATLGISGQIVEDSYTLTPFLDASYTSDAQNAYMDSLGNSIAAQSIALGQLSAGLDFEFPLNEMTLLNGGISGIWTFSEGTGIAAIATPSFEGARARIDLGVNHQFTDANGISVSGFYDGLGTPDFQSYGLEISWDVRF